MLPDWGAMECRNKGPITALLHKLQERRKDVHDAGFHVLSCIQ